MPPAKKIILYAAAIFLCIVLAVVIVVAVLAGRFLYTSPETPGREVIVQLEPGTTLQRAAWILYNNGVISNPKYFILLADFKSAEKLIRAGEFTMHTSWRPQRVLDELVSGRPTAHKLLLPEGLPWWNVAAIVADSGLGPSDKFSGVIRDQRLLNKYNIPFDSAEGFLFPDTYHVVKDMSGNPEALVERLLEHFWLKTKDVWNSSPPDPEQVKYIITLASLVEKETSVPEERRRVAGVYANRLRLGMLLQCDPTIIYGLGPDFSGALRKSQLADKSNPYNTYIHPGLPPGPICSPGLASIEAAADPEIHDYLYFVAKGNGRHQFSRTLSEHNAAVYQYRKLNSRR